MKSIPIELKRLFACSLGRTNLILNGTHHAIGAALGSPTHNTLLSIPM
jgi:hypothetical protein